MSKGSHSKNWFLVNGPLSKDFSRDCDGPAERREEGQTHGRAWQEAPALTHMVRLIDSLSGVIYLTRQPTRVGGDEVHTGGDWGGTGCGLTVRERLFPLRL